VSPLRDDGLREEVVALAADLIRADTTNPPGSETTAAVIVRDYLLRNGVAAELVARDPSRANVVARLPGSGGAASIALIGHTDVVYAAPTDWTVDPFGGVVRGDHLWGRGALDMKGHVACNAVAIARLCRSGFRPRGDVVLIAESDEEAGVGGCGLDWLVAERPDLRTDYAVNEGSAGRVELADGRVAYFLAAGEKATMPVRLVVHGSGGHASLPTAGDNALLKLGAVLERVASYEPAIEVQPEIAALLDVLVPGDAPLDVRIDRARRLHPVIDASLPALMSTTLVPTMTRASLKRNVIPSRAEVTCDCRVLPGTTSEDLRADLERLLADLDVTIEEVEAPLGGTRSPLGTALERAIRAGIREHEPQALLVPILCTGFTNSHHLRATFGTVAYGFFPLRHTDPRLLATVHAADERIHVADLVDGVRFLEGVVRRVAG
jgi:acetylornithine deacetylase/succinyl-diaminopimelate desuccinylase-like protein